jgi:hypothetical protein
MSYVLGLVVAATVLGATPTGSEEVGCLGMSVRWMDDGVTVGTSLNNRHDTESTAVIKEGESEPPEMIAIIERNREERERQVVMDR